MSDTDTATLAELTAAVRDLVVAVRPALDPARRPTWEQERWAPSAAAFGVEVSPLANDARGNPGHVVADELIESAWGNSVADRVVRVYATTAERDSLWAAPPVGAVCHTTDTGTVWRRLTGGWSRMNATRGQAAGPPGNYPTGTQFVWVAIPSDPAPRTASYTYNGLVTANGILDIFAMLNDASIGAAYRHPGGTGVTAMVSFTVQGVSLAANAAHRIGFSNIGSTAGFPADSTFNSMHWTVQPA